MINYTRYIIYEYDLTICSGVTTIYIKHNIAYFGLHDLVLSSEAKASRKWRQSDVLGHPGGESTRLDFCGMR